MKPAARAWIAMTLASLFCVASSGATPASPPVYAGVAPFDGILSVLTFNVKGSNWPVAWDRPEALRRIADRLEALRRAGRNPEVVVLQESFSSDARAIGAEAGYHYVVDGPAADESDPVPMTDADRRFAEGASWWRGETEGRMVGSGLQILSDYPILRIRRMAFPAFACAGYDCLANKGALLVTIAIPGTPSPVDIATTHLNSRRSSGVDDARSLYAYRRQVDFLTAFINRWHDPALPLIAAGDFNAGDAPQRWAALRAGISGWHGAGAWRDALSAVAEARTERRAALPDSFAAIFHHGADWAFFTPGARLALDPVAIRVPFGWEADGTMLSDHMGYTSLFRFAGRSSARPLRSGT